MFLSAGPEITFVHFLRMILFNHCHQFMKWKLHTVLVLREQWFILFDRLAKLHQETLCKCLDGDCCCCNKIRAHRGHPSAVIHLLTRRQPKNQHLSTRIHFLTCNHHLTRPRYPGKSNCGRILKPANMQRPTQYEGISPFATNIKKHYCKEG